MVGVIFNYIVVDMAPLGATFGTRLDIDVWHVFLRGFSWDKWRYDRWPYQARSTLSALNRGSTSWRTKTKPGGKADSERRSATVSALHGNTTFHFNPDIVRDAA
jgi:hypothetical protein